jgi:hypothetical protein
MRAVVGVVAFCIALTGTILANQFVTMMIAEINRRRDEHSQIAYLGFTPSKVLLVHSEYRRLYPAGRLHTMTLVSMGVVVVAMLMVAVCIGIVG